MSGIITLTTDFGSKDPYVGVMKGVVLGRSPDARLVDLTNDVAPQVVVEGAFLLQSAWRYFPEGTVHIVVVDPGVGTERRRLALRVAGHFFVGPDNGVLSAALTDSARGPRAPGTAYEARTIALPRDAEAASIEDEAMMITPVSATFEGRDVFAPVAAALSRGVGLTRLGPPLREIQLLPAFRAPRTARQVEGLVIHVDRFGNVVTDIRKEDLSYPFVFTIGEERVEGLARTYGESDGLCAVVGSSGYLEIALAGGSAAERLGVARGAPVTAS